MTVTTTSQSKRIMILGATGTIGHAALRILIERGHKVVALIRPTSRNWQNILGAEIRFGDVTDACSVANDAFRGEKFDILLSCLASRNGTTEDSWRIDYQAHMDTLSAAKAAGASHFILVSAICVQKPRLPFQHAKLAFETELIESGMNYSIVRPTAFFKSLSGQVERVRNGKSFLLFGDGQLTACKPIGDDDLAEYLADCIDNPDLLNRILPIGGPGEAITPKQQGEMLFELLGKPPHFKYVPVKMLDLIIAGLDLAGRYIPAAARKAELARIGRYYATESMLVLDPVTGTYNAAATPSTGTQTLRGYYQRLIKGEAIAERGEHSVF